MHLENGFTKVDDQLLDAVISQPFTKRQCKVLLAVIRKTDGYNKSLDDVAASQIAALTGIDRANVIRTINELVGLNVMFKSPGRFGQMIGINRDIRSWNPPVDNMCQNSTGDAETAPAEVPNQHLHRCQNSTGIDAKLAPTINNTQKTITTTPPQTPETVRAETFDRGGACLIFPKAMTTLEQQEAQHLFAGISHADIQSILDVLAVMIIAGDIRKSNLAVLSGLVRRFREGRFDPTPGLHLAEQRQRHAKRQQAEQQRARAYQQALLQRSVNSEQQGHGIADVRAALKRRHSSG